MIIGDGFGAYPHQIVRKVITAPSHDIIGSEIEGEGEVIVLEAGHEISPSEGLAHDQPVDVSYSLDSFDHNDGPSDVHYETTGLYADGHHYGDNQGKTDE